MVMVEILQFFILIKNSPMSVGISAGGDSSLGIHQTTRHDKELQIILLNACGVPVGQETSDCSGTGTGAEIQHGVPRNSEVLDEELNEPPGFLTAVKHGFVATFSMNHNLLLRNRELDDVGQGLTRQEVEQITAHVGRVTSRGDSYEPGNNEELSVVIQVST